uniref:Transforming growth factor beta superfamily signaling ligand n=1 Tax=Ciona intestinalis TaxID=7719 RepID=Q4H393_CIOIN|nr:transforming growth factor beta superfamily signaling ligand precursor [Ciona intestinalis]BAE06534.1 transforming growth factor beta superfamily signaling ligand [Ciona intestinalis]|eukprot:NP_001071997.1 transforming growth factor beta superfamily signaling ligand precursor [Ciona intestinalis]
MFPIKIILLITSIQFSTATQHDDLQDGILTHLGLGKLPTFTQMDLSQVVVPDHIRARYEQLVAARESRLGRNRRIRSAGPSLAGLFRNVHQKTGIEGDVIYSDTFREQLKFDMEGKIPDKTTITMAELRLFKKLPNHSRLGAYTVKHRATSGSRNDVERPSVRRSPQVIRHARVSIHHSLPLPNGDVITELVDSRLIMVNGSGWQSFDITSAIRKWQRHPVKFMTITLELKVQSTRPGRVASEVARMIRFTGQKVALDSPRRPELVVFTEEEEKTRTNDCSASRHRRHRKCCREKRFISFREMEWAKDWIIEPSGYDAYQCAGGCSSSRRKNSKRSPRSCTVAESTSLPVMYLVKDGDGTKVEVSEFPNMVVEKCACSLDSVFGV